MNTNYTPDSDSPFDDIYSLWLLAEEDEDDSKFLEQYDSQHLDEIASCARSLTRRFPDDARVRSFIVALEAECLRKIRAAKYDEALELLDELLEAVRDVETSELTYAVDGKDFLWAKDWIASVEARRDSLVARR